MQESLRTAKKAVGAKQVARALRNGQALHVFLASDADPKVTEPIVRLCEEANVPHEMVSSMVTLGKHCGISVGSAVAATIKI